MPLVVKDVEWSETEKNIVLKVPLKGASKKNVDLFSSGNYIKVSFPPYLYEVGLYDLIDDESSKATIANGLVVFHLVKMQSKLWGQLCVDQHKDKVFMKELRENALRSHHEKEALRFQQQSEHRDQQKKFAVKQQMRIDGEERQLREKHKLEEMKEISEDVQKWKVQDCDHSNNNNNNTIIKDDALLSYTCEEESARQATTTPEQNFTTRTNDEKARVVSEDNKTNIGNNTNNSKDEKSQSEELDSPLKKSIPQPRTCGNIDVNFTPRQLPTPARESKLPEEEIWLKKVAEMNKIKKVDNKDDVIDMEEMNPVWLKEKGNTFFKNGNYVAAINAYTSALMLDGNIPMLYANRAACHLTLRQFTECIQDCTNALELYDPPVSANAMSRCRALTRRGTAFYQIEQYVNALRDYEAAIKLDPKNDALRTDAFKIRRTIQGGDSSD